MAGGLIIGLMACYGSEQIRARYPEVLEVILIGRSRIGLKGGDPKAVIVRIVDCRRALWRGRPNHHDRRSFWFPLCTSIQAVGGRAQDPAGGRGGGRHGSYFCRPAAGLGADRRGATTFRMETTKFHPVPCFPPSPLRPYASHCSEADPIFPVVMHTSLSTEEMIYCLEVGILAGFGSGLLTFLVYAFEDLFRKLPIHWMYWPIIGGFLSAWAA